MFVVFEAPCSYLIAETVLYRSLVKSLFVKRWEHVSRLEADRVLYSFRMRALAANRHRATLHVISYTLNMACDDTVERSMR